MTALVEYPPHGALHGYTTARVSWFLGNHQHQKRSGFALSCAPAVILSREPARVAFLRGYGRIPRDLPWWRGIALARLACRAEELRHRPAEAASLRAEIDRP